MKLYLYLYVEHFLMYSFTEGCPKYIKIHVNK